LFDTIHRRNYWGSDESISGGGSTVSRTQAYAERLIALIGDEGFTTMFDAPCGDLNWMGRVIDETAILYQGGDVSELALQAARANRAGVNVRLFDLRNDEFPDADFWHCRDCMFHLSFDDGLAVLRNFGRCTIPYALITTNTARWLKNIDIETGGHRVTDLERAPYNLPKPLVRLKDYPSGKEFPRYVAMWWREDIARAVG